MAQRQLRSVHRVVKCSRGIATALKLRAIAHARGLGVRAIRTRQHDGNAPMLHVNARLGFRRGPADIRFEKALC